MPVRALECEPRPAPALRFDLTCPRCGHDVDLIAGGIPGLKQTQAVVSCTGPCVKQPSNASWVVRVTLEPFNRGNAPVMAKGAA